MTGFERVSAALEGKRSDRKPRGEIFISLDTAEKLSSRRGLEAFLETVDILAVDLVTIDPSIWSSSDIEKIISWAKRNRLFVFLITPGSLTFLASSLGYERALALLAKDFNSYRGQLESFVKEDTRRLLGYLDLGIDGFIIGDDIATDEGLFISLNHFREFLLPFLKLKINLVHKTKKAPFIFHSDGSFLSILPDLEDAGFLGVHGLSLSPGNFKGIAKIMTSMIFWGGLKFDKGSEFKNETELRQEVRELLDSRTKNIILGSTSGLYDGLPVDIIRAAYQNCFNSGASSSAPKEKEGLASVKLF